MVPVQLLPQFVCLPAADKPRLRDGAHLNSYRSQAMPTLRWQLNSHIK